MHFGAGFNNWTSFYQHLHILFQFSQESNWVVFFGFAIELPCSLDNTVSYLIHSTMSSTTADDSQTPNCVFASSSSPSFVVSFLIVFTQVLMPFFLSTSNIRTKIGVKAMRTIDVIYRVNSIKRPPKCFLRHSECIVWSLEEWDVKGRKINRRESFHGFFFVSRFVHHLEFLSISFVQLSWRPKIDI